MNHLHRTSVAEVNTQDCAGSNASGQSVRWLRTGVEAPGLSTLSIGNTHRMGTAVAVACLLASSLLVTSPAMAQLHGDWPSDVHFTRVSDASPSHSGRFDGRGGSDSRMDVPRGDLRKDVADAARMDSKRPAR